MSDFGTLKRRIAQDLDRHLERLHGDEIGQAVKDAIQFYQHEGLTFQEYEETSITTVAGTPNYVRPTEVVDIDEVTITRDGTRYLLERQQWEWYLEAAAQPTSVLSFPSAYIFFGDQFWFYPTPDDAYDVSIWATQQFDELVDDTDENSWTRPTAGELIRAHAKADLFANRLDMPDKAQIQMDVAKIHLRRLRESTTTRISSGFVRPTYF